MTKINNLISMEEAIKMKEMAYSERNLLNISKAVIDKVADDNAKQLEENIDIEVRLAVQEAFIISRQAGIMRKKSMHIT